jgi:hypothetical protein
MPDQPFGDYHILGVDHHFGIPPNDGVFLTPSFGSTEEDILAALQLALDTAWTLKRYPKLIQDACLRCHWYEGHGLRPRWNINHNRDYPPTVPVCAWNGDLAMPWTGDYWPPVRWGDVIP